MLHRIHDCCSTSSFQRLPLQGAGVYQTSFSSASMTSPEAPFSPKYTPHVIWASAPQTARHLHKTASPKSMPKTFSTFPLHRSYAVCSSTIHLMTECLGFNLAPVLSSTALRVSRTCCWTDRMPAPRCHCWHFFQQGLSRRCTCRRRSCSNSSTPVTTNMVAGSCFDFTTISQCSQPISLRSATTLLGRNVPVDSLGAAEATVILDNRSRTESTGNVSPGWASSPKKAKSK